VLVVALALALLDALALAVADPLLVPAAAAMTRVTVVWLVPVALVAPITRSKIPLAPGVPLITPVELVKVSPAGRVPVDEAVSEGLAVIVYVSGVPTVALIRADDEITGEPAIGAATVNESEAGVVPAVLVAMIVTEPLLLAEGVPEICPLAASMVRPNGNPLVLKLVAPVARIV
jgi:hypothetical protein